MTSKIISDGGQRVLPDLPQKFTSNLESKQ